MIRNKTNWTRRLATSAVILIVAIVIAVWASRHERAKYENIRKCIDCLAQSYVAGGDPNMPPPCAGCDGMQSALKKLHSLVITIPDGQMNLFEVKVGPKGMSPFENSAASHEAMILVGGKLRLGLAVDATANQVYINGYWDPQAGQ